MSGIGFLGVQRLGVVVLTLALACAARAQAPQPQVPIASRVAIAARGSETQITFAVDRPVSGVAYVLGDPDRAIVDLPQVDFRIDPDVGRSGAGAASDPARSLVKSFRFGLFAPGRSRIVIDLTRPAKVERAATETLPDGKLVFVLALADTSAAAFRSAAAAPSAPRAAQPTAPLRPADPASVEPLVVLDPGHGGVDTGALGPPGVVEKAITFAFAQALAAKLRQDGQVRVLLTRTQDVFVPLGERVRIARAANASLFMSIHADSIVGASEVSGATIYTLSNRASDSEAARVAAHENQADAAGGLSEKASSDEDEVKDILFDLARRETRAYSGLFAQTLLQAWGSAGALNHNPHRSARFVVLKAPDVPSVLLELGYLSSARDVRFLTDPAWRDRAAQAVARAIEAFFASRRSDVATQDASAQGGAHAAAAPAVRPGSAP
jgi:N-acetylmuramoyl-L-alanine amidase